MVDGDLDQYSRDTLIGCGKGRRKDPNRETPRPTSNTCGLLSLHTMTRKNHKLCPLIAYSGTILYRSPLRRPLQSILGADWRKKSLHRNSV